MHLKNRNSFLWLEGKLLCQDITVKARENKKEKIILEKKSQKNEAERSKGGWKTTSIDWKIRIRIEKYWSANIDRKIRGRTKIK